MNKERREAIRNVRVKLAAISAEIEGLRNLEEIALGNLDEKRPQSQQAKQMERVIGHLGDAMCCVDTADSWLELAVK
jgi:hypothetical protein